jgi:hypothetical protein
MTGPKIQALLNGIVGLRPGWKHLEVGVHQGKTFISAMKGNMEALGVCYENFCEFDGGGNSKRELMQNFDEFRGEMGPFVWMCEDFFNREPLHEGFLPFDSFFYDGEHSPDGQRNAVVEAFKLCADEFIYIVDDYGNDFVRVGTEIGLDMYSGKEMKIWEFGMGRNESDWHQGLGLFWIRKSK